MIVALWAAVSPVLLGWVLLRWLVPGAAQQRLGLLLQLCMALALGIALSSGLFFVWLVLFNRADRQYLLAESACGLLLLGAWRWRHRKGLPGQLWQAPVPPSDTPPRLLAVCSASIVLLGVAAIIYTLAINPHGAYDSWAIWNTQARFLYRGAAHWRDMFQPFAMFHPDYPLLLSASIARMWTALGAETTLVPAGFSLLFTLLTAALLYAGIALNADRTRAAVALAFLFGTSNYIYAGSGQLADVPLGLFFLAALLCLSFGAQSSSGAWRWYLCAGLFASSAPWVKNEGWLFLVAVLVAWPAIGLLEHGRAAWRWLILPLIAGALPMLVLVGAFKLFLAPPSDLSAGQTLPALLAKLSDPQRYYQIAHGFVRLFLFLGRGTLVAFTLYCLVVGFARPAGSRSAVLAPLALFGLMFCGYVSVYLLTPYVVFWHVSASVDRLLLQIWPSLLFVAARWTRGVLR